MKSKQVLFGIGIGLQLVVLTTTFYFLHEIHQKTDHLTIFNEELEDECMVETSHASYEKGVKVPFIHFVTGVGEVMCSNYVKINTRRDGIVDQVFVNVGQRVRAGDPLFQIDDSSLKYALREKLAEHDTAMAQLKLLERRPSEIDLRAKEKEIEQVKFKMGQKEKECKIFDLLLDKCAVSQREKEQQESLLKLAAIELDRVNAEYDQVRRGISEEEKDIGKALVKEREARIRLIEKQMGDCLVKAPADGKILAVNLNPGQFVDPAGESAVVIGSDDPLHLHVFVDEREAWRVSPTSSLKAIAVHKSNPKIHFILQFVCAKPEASNGKLELIFSFDKGKAPIYLEQNLDVYIEAASPTDTAYLDYQFNQMMK